MVAAYVRGKRRVYGTNRLDDPASVHSGHYPERCGRHAEQNIIELCERNGIELRGGTMYVLGVTNNASRNVMRNTAPCRYCRPVLNQTRIRRLVYISDGNYVKEILHAN
jgi:deoxycytidylate deaminase